VTPYERAMNEIEAERHPPGQEWFRAELRLLHERYDVFAHPFYVRWSAGELKDGELRDFAEEHDHLILTLATVARGAAAKAEGLLGDVLADHVAVVDERAEQWLDFAKESGWGAGTAWHFGEDPYPETVDCVSVWLGDPSRRLALDLVTLIAAETELDAVVRSGLAGLLPSEDPFSLLAHAAAVHRAYWGVLDALEVVRTR